MMLIDTAIFIDYLKGIENAAAVVVDARGAGDVLMHAVVAAELVAGILNRSELRPMRRFFWKRMGWGCAGDSGRGKG